MYEKNTFIEVPFYDVDSMDITWHGNYVKYFELARCELLASLGYDYKKMKESGYAWPIIDLNIRYIQPSRFQQRLRVNSRLVEWEHRLKITYVIYDADTNQRLTKGYSVQVAVNVKTGEMCFASPAVLEEALRKNNVIS